MKLVIPFLIGATMLLSNKPLSAFQLYCPGDVWVNCQDELWDLSIYGSAYYEVYGINYNAGPASVVYDLSSCNTGVIYRTWTVEDPYWNPVSCTQKIYVSGGYFGINNIDWPHQELQVYGCNTSIHPNDLPYGYDRPRYDYLTCSHIGTSYNDKVFTFGPDCKKVIRKWTLIDWCNYNSGSNYQGIWTFSQVIKISNTETPLLSCAKEVVVNALECEGSFINLDDVYVEGQSCTGNYHITHNSQYAIKNGGNASGFYPVGSTRVTYFVEYACGKEKKCHTDVVVKDTKPAVPYCYAGLNVALMPVDSDNNGTIDDGMVEIWAEDLNVGSYHPCGNGPLKFSFSSDVTERSKTFTCDEVGVNSVQMWVTDKNGNQSYCVVTINVQNNAANIPDCKPDEGQKYILSGKVLDETSSEINQVQITLKDNNPIYKYITEKDSIYNYEIIDSFYNAGNALVYIYDLTIRYEDRIVDSIVNYNVMHLNTNQNGVYGTNDILLQRNYNITAYKAGDMSRITNDDLIVLNGFIEGNIEFDSPYAYLAADINEDGVIDENDAWILEDIISGEEDEWPNERQWIFYNMSEMARMSDYPLEDGLSQNVYIENIQNKNHHLDFMGILKGDLDKFVKEEELDESKLESLKNREAEDASYSNSTLIFPNPFQSRLTIDMSEAKGEGVLKMYNITGQLIYSSIIGGGEMYIVKEVKEWEQGVYFYQIHIGDERHSGKLIKE